MDGIVRQLIADFVRARKTRSVKTKALKVTTKWMKALLGMLTQQGDVEGANERDAEGRRQRRGEVNAQFTMR